MECCFPEAAELSELAGCAAVEDVIAAAGGDFGAVGVMEDSSDIPGSSLSMEEGRGRKKRGVSNCVQLRQSIIEPQFSPALRVRVSIYVRH